MNTTGHNKSNIGCKISKKYPVKTVIMGDFGVGKSTISHLLIAGKDNPNMSSTIGVSFISKHIPLNYYNDHVIVLQVWDLAGQERFRSIVKTYMRGALLALIVFDITDRSTWEHIDEWREELLNYKRYNSLPVVALVANKSDLGNHQVSESEIKEKADEWNCKYYIISSKYENSGQMIYNIFSDGAESLHERIIYDYDSGFDLPPNILENSRRKLDIMSASKLSSWCCYI